MLIVLAGCSPGQGVEVEPRAVVDALSAVEARSRGARIDRIAYQVHIDLTGADRGADHFTGDARLDFALSGTDEDLTVDFSGARDLTITLNRQISDVPYNGYFLTLPRELLRPGANTLEVRYTQSYGHDGTGLHRFVDPEDGATYLYTYLWPYYANRLFPLFDQPDLKARYELEVRAPQSWSVVSTTAGSKRSTDRGDALWSFAPTPPISSYVFSLHAGPYQVWEDDADGIPLRLLARQSLAPHVAVQEWFALTRAGLGFFAEYFETPYPFGKYDQLIVPDFNIGAMENVAAVTFNEQYVQRQPSSDAQREDRANTILHEMAHMWFGNLVTHRWWNGLWLNESFATQMAHLALVATTPFSDTWHRFFTQDEQRAYYRDSRVTTHPVEVPVASTADFFTVFDAITYEKGSAVLRQLAHYVGEENYRRGVVEYLHAHAYATTELADFITNQARFAGRPLDGWAAEWLDTAGFNELATDFECDAGTLSRLTVTQSAVPEFPTLRTHRVDIALYSEDADGRLQRPSVIPAEIGGAVSQIAVPDGAPCPVLVFPNHHDWTYAKVTMPEDQVAQFSQRIAQVADPLARSMLLQTLADRTRAGKLPIVRFMEIAAENAAVEPDFVVLSQLLGLLRDASALLERLHAVAELDRLTPPLESLSWERTAAAPDGDLRRLWFGLHVALARSAASQQRLAELLDGRRTLPGLEISQDERWRMLRRLSQLGAVGADARITEELVRDPSDRGEKMAIAARAALPDLAQKRRLLREIQEPASLLGLARKRYAMFNLFPPDQTDLQQQLLTAILDPLPELSRTSDDYYTSSYVEGLLGPVCSATSAQTMGRYLDLPLSSTARRLLREAQQADMECARLGNEIR